jgi:Trk K+ transport system NAD-binding subunit
MFTKIAVLGLGKVGRLAAELLSARAASSERR